ncbi:hypothetical protein [Streptomyces fructofermentans]|uniref:hypothetical protein n=1 Tax=Streptomyces fructofermentans TaxID=152141 RepID=UPI0033EC505B
MTTLAQVRKAALALPEVTEGAAAGTVVFAVRDRRFVSVTGEGQVLLRLPEDAIGAALTAHPGGERLVRGDRPVGVRVPLADVNGMDMNWLVRAAWFGTAPKRLAASLTAAEGSADAPDGDLPAGIGRPATRALLGADVRSLEEVARHTEAELLALHGVGPKAVRVLAEALERKGLAFRT